MMMGVAGDYEKDGGARGLLLKSDKTGVLTRV